MSTLVRLLGYLKPYRNRVVFGFVCLLVDVGLELAPGFVWMFIVDRVVLAKDLRGLPFALAALVLIGLSEAFVSRARRITLEGTAQNFTFDLRRDLFAKLSRMPLGFFNEAQTGDLISRVTSDVESIQDVVVVGTDNLVANFLRLVGVFTIFCTLNLQLGIAAFSPIIVVGLLLRHFNRQIKSVYAGARKGLGTMTSLLSDTLGGIRVVKAFGREAHARDQFFAVGQSLLHTNIAGVRARANVFPFISFIASLTNVVTLGFGSWLILKGQFTIGGMIAYRTYGRYFFGPIDNLSQINDFVQRAIAGGNRVFAIIDAPETVTDAPNAPDLPAVKGRLEFKDVHFSYNNNEVLKGVSFVAEPGQKVAIVGESGAGKSTVFRLIQRFWDPTEGQVLIDGHGLNEVTQASLRGQVVSVQQDTFLFAESVRENIRYGRLDATDEEVEQAAIAANAHGFICQLPKGYETLVGERGVKLSGGQRQRISVARAFLTQGRLLILDEATSAVEPESERLIYESLQKLVGGQTTLIATHRLSTIKGADMILVMSSGRIVERGTHAKLMAVNGLYARMVSEQEAGELLLA